MYQNISLSLELIWGNMLLEFQRQAWSICLNCETQKQAWFVVCKSNFLNCLTARVIPAQVQALERPNVLKLRKATRHDVWVVYV